MSASSRLHSNLLEWSFEFTYFAECQQVFTTKGIYALSQLTRRDRYEAQGVVQGQHVEKVRKSLIRARANLTFKLKLREMHETLQTVSESLGVIAAIDESLPFIVCMTALFPDQCWASYALGGARDELSLGDFDINHDFGFNKRQVRYIQRLKDYCDRLPLDFETFGEDIYSSALKLDLINGISDSFSFEDLKHDFEKAWS